MKKYIALFFSVSFFLTACKGHKISGDIIEPKKMTSLLTAVHLVDGRLYTVMQNPDSLYKYGTARYLLIFKEFDTDSVQFNNSMKYYAGQPAQFLAIYDQVLLNLKQKSDSLNLIQATVNKKTDSIARIKIKKLNDSLQKKQGAITRPDAFRRNLQMKPNAVPQK